MSQAVGTDKKVYFNVVVYVTDILLCSNLMNVFMFVDEIIWNSIALSDKSDVCKKGVIIKYVDKCNIGVLFCRTVVDRLLIQVQLTNFSNSALVW